jgi:response regulator RpfG family c-di-GMP phosphodiesterase
MADKILCVDDDPGMLGLYRLLHDQQRKLGEIFDIETASSGEEGLEAIRRGSSYAVIISDMVMPGLDGVQFLSQVRELAPATVRMMLTGHADLNVALNALNEGNLFRFLTKPCTAASLLGALTAGVRQYRLVMAEKELLEKTLAGCIKMLADVLSLVSPAAFSRAVRVQRWVQRLATALGIEDAWQLEVAALLSQTGCVMLPESILAKVCSGAELTPEESALYKAHPKVGRDLIASIPRLEAVAAIIAYQEKGFDGSGVPDDGKRGQEIPLGARILKVALDFDELEYQGLPGRKALARMQHRPGRYDPAVLDVLTGLVLVDARMEIKELSLRDLMAPLEITANTDPTHARNGTYGGGQLAPMVLAEDMLSNKGVLMLSRGQKITLALLQRLRNLACGSVIREPIRVWALSDEAHRQPPVSSVSTSLSGGP